LRLNKVSELIDPITGGCDEELLNQTLWPEDAEVVRALPVRNDLNDVLAWHFDV